MPDISRRSFILASLAAIPGVRALFGPAQVCEYKFSVPDADPLVFTSYTDGTLRGHRGNREMQSEDSGDGYVLFTEKDNSIARVRLEPSKCLRVDWFTIWG
jgi:hypothetical protein